MPYDSQDHLWKLRDMSILSYGPGYSSDSLNFMGWLYLGLGLGDIFKENEKFYKVISYFLQIYGRIYAI